MALEEVNNNNEEYLLAFDKKEFLRDFKRLKANSMEVLEAVVAST